MNYSSTPKPKVCEDCLRYMGHRDEIVSKGGVLFLQAVDCLACDKQGFVTSVPVNTKTCASKYRRVYWGPKKDIEI